MKVAELVNRLKDFPEGLDVEIEPCEPVCLGGGPIRSVWVENGDDGGPILVLSRVSEDAEP